jgi:hypothetical protein
MRGFTLFIDSEYRDRTQDAGLRKAPRTALDRGNTAPFDFRVELPSGQIEHVRCVELKGLSLPKARDCPFVYVDVNDWDNGFTTTCPSVGSAIGAVYFDSAQMAVGAVKPVKGADFTSKRVPFVPSLASFKDVRVRILKPDGTVLRKQDVTDEDDCTNVDPRVTLMLQVEVQTDMTDV